MPDEVNMADGTYTLWLSPDSRQQFHETLCAVLDALFPVDLIEADSSSDSELFNDISIQSFHSERPSLTGKSFLERAESPPRRSLPVRRESPHRKKSPEKKQTPPSNPAICNPKGNLFISYSTCQ